MQGFIRGIANQIDPLRRLLGSIGPMLPDQMNLVGVGAAPASTAASVQQEVNFNFPGVRSAEDAKEIESALSSSQVMGTLLDALRAGRRTA
jgi:hypothetical protein